MQHLDLLILGAGWTSTFLIPLARKKHLTFAATTRDGREVAGSATLKWSFDPTSNDDKQFSHLPLARNVLITFPLKGKGQSELLVKGYEKVWEKYCSTSSSSSSSSGDGVHFVQLGSTGIWQVGSQQSSSCWLDRKSAYDAENARAIAEDELLSLGNGSVLNLAGLWGGERDPRNWISRVATTKAQVQAKTSLHLIHGEDVARAILALVGKWESVRGERWMLTDGFVYDWWALFAAWADVKGGGGEGKPSEQATWVYEWLAEGGARALPRSMEALGRCYDSREFWGTFGLAPLKGGV